SNSLYGRTGDRHTGRAPAAVEKNLRHQTAKAMSDDDRRSFELANDLLVMIDNVFESKRGEAAWIAAKLFDVAFHARPASGDDAITFVRVMFNPVLPAKRCHPEAGDENDGGDVHCEELAARASRSPGNWSLSGGRKLNAAKLLMSSGSCL